MKKAIILSAKFAPGHFSHMVAYDKLFRTIGYESTLLLDNGYESFTKDYPECSYISLNDIDMIKADILLIYNMSIRDTKYLRLLKQRNKKLKVFFVYHEPWFGYKKWFNDFATKKESFIDSLKTLARYYFAIPILKSANTVLLPSRKAEEYYNKICIKFNSNHKIFPLVFTDEANGQYDIIQKRFFSFISTVQNSKNFKMFLDYVKFKVKKDSSALFQIATRSNISEYLDEELQNLIRQKRLIVNHGHPLSNDEINHAYAISNCTWMLYNRSTQSGVLCKSFMFGSPVIASNIGSFREIVDDSNGIILNGDYSLDDIDRAYESIRINQGRLLNGTRETFISKFLYTSHIDELNEILESSVYYD